MNLPSFLKPSGTPTTTREINGEDVDFYPLTMAGLARFRKVAKNVGPALRDLLFFDPDSEVGSTQETSVKNGETTSITKVEAKAPQIVATHRQLRVQDLGVVIETSLGEEGQIALAKCIVDSCPGLFDDDLKADDAWARSFLKEVSVPVFVELVVGMWMANVGAFGAEVAEKAAGKLKPVPMPPSSTPTSEESSSS